MAESLADLNHGSEVPDVDLVNGKTSGRNKK